MKALWGIRHTTWDGSGGGDVHFPAVRQCSGRRETCAGKAWHFKPWLSARISRAARDIFRAPFVTGGDFCYGARWRVTETEAERRSGKEEHLERSRQRGKDWRDGEEEGQWRRGFASSQKVWLLGLEGGRGEFKERKSALQVIAIQKNESQWRWQTRRRVKALNTLPRQSVCCCVFPPTNDFHHDVGPHFFPRRKSHPLPSLILSGDPGEVSEAEVMVQHVRGRTLGFFGGAGGVNVPGNRMCGRGTQQKR